MPVTRYVKFRPMPGPYVDSLWQRQMLQWIAALEKVARESHYIGRNRFDSFAPIRLNVAAQWLVDGVISICYSRFP